MAGYKYEAIDSQSGVVRHGVLNADNASDARRSIRTEMGCLPLSVAELTTEEVAVSDRGLPWRRVSTTQLSLFTRQFSSLLAGNITVEKALDASIRQTESRWLRQAVAGVRGKVLEGNTLAQAMRNFPNIFPELYCALIAAGESSGELDKVLVNMADYLEQAQELRRKTGQAMLYPLIVGTVAVLVVLGLMTYVVPQVVVVFERNNQTLPLLTRLMLFTSEFLQQNGAYLFIAAIALLIMINKLLRIESWRRRFHSLLLRLPFIGLFIRDLNSARLSSALAILVNSNVPLLTSLEAGARVITNVPMREALVDVASMVREGASLSRSMEKSEMFPPIMESFIAGGEESGRLGEMLSRAANQQAKELEHRIATLTTLFEPLLIITMGLIVLLIVLAVLLPIFDLSQVIR